MWQQIGLLLGIAVVLVIAHEQLREHEYRKKSKQYNCTPPYAMMDRPFGLPNIITLLKYNSRNKVLQFFLERLTAYDVWTARVQSVGDILMLTVDPENIKSILATNFKDYSLGDRYQQLFPLLGNGIFTLSGEGWKHSRAMLRPQFSRDQVSQLETLKDHVGTLLEVFKSKSATGEFFDCQAHFHELTMDTATEFLFGESVDSLKDSKRLVQGPTRLVSAADFATCFTDSLDYLALRTRCGPLYWAIDSFAFRKKISICHNFVEYFVHRALEKPMEPEQEAERYVFINELTKETRDPVVIRDQAFNVLLAGRDTTASLLSFVIYYLSRHPHIWNKLREEILDDFGTDDSKLTFETLKRCTYLNHVVSEVLRLHPIVPMNFRQALRDTVLPRGGGPDGSEPVFVPKGTRVVYIIHVTQRLEKLWGPDAAEFRPDRWSESKLHSWDYLPFNGGPRICIGQQFALTETYFTLVRVLQTFKEVHFTGDPDYHDLGQWTKLTTSVANGVMVKFTPA